MTAKDAPFGVHSKVSSREVKEAAILRLAQSKERLNLSVTNDFAFKTVFRNKKVLKGLLSALLDIPIRSITSIELPDPVAPGEFPDDKMGIVDIKIILNYNWKINIEMQVLPFPFWEERSLFYLCKMFVENLKKGMGYDSLEACTMISILKYDLFECEDFYSNIQLIDRKTGRLYSDKINLHVLQLNQLEKATDKQRQSDLYLWARMISANDWEVLEMLAKQNEYIGEAVQELEKINSDPAKRYEYLYREMKELDENTIRNYFIAKGKAYATEELFHLIDLMANGGDGDKIPALGKDPLLRQQMSTKYHIDVS